MVVKEDGWLLRSVECGNLVFYTWSAEVHAVGAASTPSMFFQVPVSLDEEGLLSNNFVARLQDPQRRASPLIPVKCGTCSLQAARLHAGEREERYAHCCSLT